MAPVLVAPDVTLTLSTVVRVADLTGVLANAVLGGVIARTRDFDPVGFATLAIMSGLGGGMIRDTLLQSGAPVALTDGSYIAVALVGALVAFLVPVDGRLWKRVFPWVDALAIGAWAAAGAQKTLGLGFGVVPAMLLGTLTAVGGGVVRDVVLRQIPAIFGRGTLYATSALAASGVMVLLSRLGHPAAGTLAAMGTGALMTILAQRLGWRLPTAYEWRPGRRLRSLPRPAWGDRGKDGAAGQGR